MRAAFHTSLPYASERIAKLTQCIDRYIFFSGSMYCNHLIVLPFDLNFRMPSWLGCWPVSVAVSFIVVLYLNEVIFVPLHNWFLSCQVQNVFAILSTTLSFLSFSLADCGRHFFSA